MRRFEAKKAVRSQVPLYIGLFGPPGCGKTLSALRLAKGMGGKTVVFDTENKRALHYAQHFDFYHVDFQPPFGPSDYADAIEQACTELNADNVVIDSGSHMHEGEGGILEMQTQELERLGGRDSMKFTSWIKPKREFVKFQLRLQRMPAKRFLFCFRAQEKLGIAKGEDPTKLGFMPIMPEQLPWSMTINALLLPGANGVPTWNSQRPGEKVMSKCPGWARSFIANGKPFDEEMGAKLAAWARGDLPVTDMGSPAGPDPE